MIVEYIQPEPLQLYNQIRVPPRNFLNKLESAAIETFNLWKADFRILAES